MDSDIPKLKLPDAPASEMGKVKVWEEPVVMATYLPAMPDLNPMFLEKRVYQGSSGRVYPLPVIDRVSTEWVEHSWKAVHIENDFLRLMVLPEIGGRIHVGLDKVNGYDFFYRQNVIKPALVGLAGPWISGGVEFNWPQHHRPATFMPVEVSIERDDDGSVTIWCSDQDPMVRMKGMHGLCLRPGSSVVELRVRLYNRTLDTQTFLWWANVATRVHEQYQSFFPSDVRFVADHAKRAISDFPLSHGVYYGVNYGERAISGVPDCEKPACFIPDGSYAPNDLSWYANIPVPTSYMAANSKGDFAGGYDHAADAGMVHVANHHISPGKKQWTWGNHEFGYAWDRNLTESDGPYVELMAGVYTDNQPDFSFLAPGETKTFSQFWYPLRETGVPDSANQDAAVRVESSDDSVMIHLQSTLELTNACVRVTRGDDQTGHWVGKLEPGYTLHHKFEIPSTAGPVVVTLSTGEGEDERVLLRFAPEEVVASPAPPVATEPAAPAEIASTDELYLVGLHLEQYRHATRQPEPYWLEVLKRDPEDSRSNNALGRWHLRRGEFHFAEQYLRTAIARLTARNPNPADGEPFYNLGLALSLQKRTSEAYDCFYKATWNAAWRGPAYHRLAEIDCSRKQWTIALDHLQRSLRGEAENLNAMNLRTVVLGRLGRKKQAETALQQALALDPLDHWSRFLKSGTIPANGQQQIDLGLDLMRAGLLAEARQVLSQAPAPAPDGSATMRLYALAQALTLLGDQEEAVEMYRQAAAASTDYVFPNRLEEIMLLEAAMKANPRDAHAPLYLGNLLYDRRRHEEAITLWERAVELDGSHASAWRSLGIAYFNVIGNVEKAKQAFECARRVAPSEARILCEQDQLLRRTGASPESRLSRLELHLESVQARDDLSIELASLYNQTGKPEQALKVMLSRRFQPWEGGEGQGLGQYVRAHLLLGQTLLTEGDCAGAISHFEAAQHPPATLSEVKHLLMNHAAVDYLLGTAYAANGESEKAAHQFERAAAQAGDFQQMQVHAISDNTYWSALALQRLGLKEEAQSLFESIHAYSQELEQQTPKIDYFATSLPTMLLFNEDLLEGQLISAHYLRAQSLIGMGRLDQGSRLLAEILSKDASHSGAADLQSSLAAVPR